MLRLKCEPNSAKYQEHGNTAQKGCIILTVQQLSSLRQLKEMSKNLTGRDHIRYWCNGGILKGSESLWGDAIDSCGSGQNPVANSSKFGS